MSGMVVCSRNSIQVIVAGRKQVFSSEMGGGWGWPADVVGPTKATVGTLARMRWEVLVGFEQMSDMV